MDKRKVLISGGGIAGLTLGILLKEKGWDPLVIEREPALRTEGYMMDFFGTGWDVSERMGLTGDIMQVSYPVDQLEYVDTNGSPRFPPVPLERVRWAFKGKYAYLRRPDLERILYNRAVSSGVTVRFSTEIIAVREGDSGVEVRLNDGTTGRFGLLFGADGIHSHVRELVFGHESKFDRFLGYYVGAFHIGSHGYETGRSLKIYEEPCRVAWVYPAGPDLMDAVFVFCHRDVGHLPRDERRWFIREQCRGMGWISERVLGEMPEGPVYFDSATQIVMPEWHRKHVALLGDACACLTLVSGQGSHMAMAGAYVLACELEKHGEDTHAAFCAYEKFLRPFIEKKQRDAMRAAGAFIPQSKIQMIYRYPLLRLALSGFFIRHVLAGFGAKSILTGYR